MNQELINNIKNWINVDNEIKKLQKNIKSLREEKKKFTINLVDIMKKKDETSQLKINRQKLYALMFEARFFDSNRI